MITPEQLLEENSKRLDSITAPFNPITGFGSVGRRERVEIPDFPLPVQYLPEDMIRVPLLQTVLRAGSIAATLALVGSEPEDSETDRIKLITQLVRIRCLYDFPFWAASYVYIKRKGGGDDTLFTLNRPQRRFVETLEQLRRANRPIRIVLLKARQWGGSTVSQIYMAWLQLVHHTGLNSLIIAHQGSGSDEIKDMFDRMISQYPVDMLHEINEQYDANAPKFVNVGKSGTIFRVPQRNCKIKVGTAERPDSCRGGDYNLIHLSEVGLWKTTDGRCPEDIVRSACSGVLLAPYTMIVYESTANGTGNFFQREYDAAKSGTSQFKAMFISWFDIEQYSLPFATDDERKNFAKRLLDGAGSVNTLTTREEPGKYLWQLWEKGATLEAINWYIDERSKYNDHGAMASEYPTDDIEAFVNSGAHVFDRTRVETLSRSVKPPKYLGELQADAPDGPGALRGIHFEEDSNGLLQIWEQPENDPQQPIAERYLTVVDIGGRSKQADFSVIVVFDRLFMMEGGKPEVVAEWYGHCDIDILAWRAAQVAKYYNNALLVIESNTLETRDRTRAVDGNQSYFILNQIADVYPNLYMRRQSEDDIRMGIPAKYGFHTNVSTKPMIISTLVKVVREGMYTERDRRAIDEYLFYERKPNGSYGAIIGKHDDLLMTRAIGLHICFYEMPTPYAVEAHGRRVQHKAISAASI